jgi:anti-sigma factor RsiW
MPVDRRVLLEAHLALCSGCHAYIAQIRETIRLTGALAEEDLTAEARDALLVVLRNWKLR